MVHNFGKIILGHFYTGDPCNLTLARVLWALRATNRASKGVDSMKNNLQVIPSSLFITTKVPNAIHGSQTQQRKVEFEGVGKMGAFQG